MAMETCENCGATIGKLETPNVWQSHIVCAQCYAKLAAPVTSAVGFNHKPPTPAAATMKLAKGEVICPNANCGYVGKPIVTTRWSTLFWLLAGFAVVLLIVITIYSEVAGPFLSQQMHASLEAHGESAMDAEDRQFFARWFAGMILGLLPIYVTFTFIGHPKICPQCGNRIRN